MSDIADDIQAAMGSLESGEPETGGEPEGVLETATDTDIPEGEEIQAGEEAPAAPVKTLEPPSNWSEQDKAAFKAAPPEVQEWALRRHNDMEAAFTKKTQEIADFRRGYEPVEQLFAPHMEELRAQGTTPAEVIQRWYQAEQFLTQNPVEGLQWLAQTFGVDLGQIGQPQEGVDPQVQALKQELSELRNAWTQREQMEVRTRQQAITNDIQTFAGEVDGSGQPAHPHFDDVVQDMVLLAQAERAAGRTPVLKDLYEKAVWANPSTREKVLVSQREAEAKKTAAEARAKAAAARKAGSSVSGAPTTGGGSATDLSLREQLEAQFRASA